MGAIIMNGKSVETGRPVKTWMETGLECKVGDGARRRTPKTLIDLFVLHWTAGEGGGPECFSVLDQRELGVEFCIDIQGVIWQFADPVLVDTFDAGYVNPRSIGVEITNYGFRNDPSEVPSRGKQRPLYQTSIRNKRRTLARFWPEQLVSAIALVDAVTGALPSIPRNLPGMDGQLFTGTATRGQIAHYAGVIGHFHLSDEKSDPGTDIFDAFAATGRYPFRNIV